MYVSVQCALIKKKTKLSSYIRKFRWDAKSYMTLHPTPLNLLKWGKFYFLFLSVCVYFSGPDLVGREQPVHGRCVRLDRRHTLHLHPVVHQPTGRENAHRQCCGSGSGSTGSTCFWASRIRIRIHSSELWIRILRSSCKNSKKNLDSCTILWLFLTFYLWKMM